ncbi:MAG: KilA-N domain-containing protein [Lewinellaceae bacterium]|nr:KilA-N domain-containing protein [Saprospiraceae bacterium]MCB0522763.1 KilA-N domain-containing protein [Saprospiraceae bacterium]MCB9341908.1 KilA-N domain-containing protein [Lewinellaceae bacterium]
MAKQKITVEGLSIAVERVEGVDYVSLTDIAKQTERSPAESIRDWLRNSSTLLFLETWETLHNPDFKVGQMHQFRNDAADNRKKVSPQRYVEETSAVGIISKSGRYGGTLAHSDIALNFCYWLSPSFQVYFIQEFQRLKEQEAEALGLTWNLRRELAKANYHIHSDAVRSNLVPLMEWHTKKESLHFASEADLLNLAVFGTTAKQWKTLNPDAKGNLRDSASVKELQVLANMESINATLIEQGFTKEERLAILSRRAERELTILEEVKALQEVKKLK